MFPVESCRTKINQLYFCIFDSADVSSLKLVDIKKNSRKPKIVETNFFGIVTDFPV
jgi:hypothetical protein